MTFGQLPPRSQVPLETVAEAHAEVIADAITRGWIVRGIKLGIGFWLAGLLIFAVSALFWMLVIGGLIARFMSAAPEMETASQGGSLSDVAIEQPMMENDELSVIVANRGSEDIRSLTITCTVFDYSWNPTKVSSMPGSLAAGARVQVKLVPNIDPKNGSASPCYAE